MFSNLGKPKILSSGKGLIIMQNGPLTCRRLTLPKRHILDPSKLKQFADDNFKFDD